MPGTSCLVVALYLADARHNHRRSTAVVATATIPTAATTSQIVDSIVAAHVNSTVNDDHLTGKTSRTHVAGDTGIALSAAACALPTAGAVSIAVDGINAENITLWSI